MRIERWALDEVALPGKLVHQIIEWLCRENRYFRGTLRIGLVEFAPRLEQLRRQSGLPLDRRPSPGGPR
jgi:hypothetical protein